MSSPLPTVPYEEQDMDKPLTDEEESELEEAIEEADKELGKEVAEEQAKQQDPEHLSKLFDFHGRQMQAIYDSLK